MSIIQVVALAVVAVVLIVVIRQEKPELALQISMVIGLIILGYAIWKLAGVVRVIENLARRAELNMVFLSSLLKIIGIAYVAEFGAQVCRDAGENALAFKVDLAGKVAILILAVPIISTIMETVTRLLP